MAALAFLRRVPVFADLPDDLLEKLAKEAEDFRIEAGDWLFHEGDQGDYLFVIRSGRMEVVNEGPPETVIRELKRGDVLGELALLARGTRTASIRARRDSELIGVGRDRFEDLIREVPAFAVGLTRTMGTQLAANRAPVASSGRPTTIAVLALDEGAPSLEFAGLLAGALEGHGSVAELTGDSGASVDEMAITLDRAEERADRVVLAGGVHLPNDEWTAFCFREADLVIAVTQGRPDPAWTRHPEGLRGCELVVNGSGVGDDVISLLAPRVVQVVKDQTGLTQTAGAMVRRIAGKSLGVVLSGGGARAFAHLGVMEELMTSGFEIERIGGVSLGSVVGAGFAMGASPEELVERFHGGFIETNPTGDYSLPLFSLVRGLRTRKLLEAMGGDLRIEELETRFFCLSCDLIAREPVIHRTGSLVDAVFASLSIPGVFPPIPTSDGRLLVDGGVLDNLPVETMAGTHEGPVIAVDVTGRMGDFRKPSRPGIARLSRPVRRFLTGSEAELPRLAETVVRTVTVGSIDTADAARRHADLVIQPEVDDVGLLDWSQLQRVREAGRNAARSALDASPDWLDTALKDAEM